MADIDALMRRAPVIPVLVIERLEDAVPIAESLVAGGLSLLEVTLRTPAAFEAIREMSKVPGAVIGAGTVLNERQLHAARKAGAKFAVSPGLTTPLAKAAKALDIDFLPGISSSSDIMHGLDLGLTHFKFFPAEAAGGLAALKAFASVFPTVRFCPTGGITAKTASVWLAEPAVLCVGGSWLVPRGTIDETAIRQCAEAAAALRM